MESSKKIMLSIIGVAILVIGLVGVTYAFFNYTRTGTSNTIRTGRIAFNTTQGPVINLTNIFPIDVSEGIPNDNTKVGSVTINVTGDTEYSSGIEYLVSAVNVQNTVGNKSLPISIDVSYSANGNGKVIGTLDDNYFTNRNTATTSIYKVLNKNTIKSSDELVVGYIAPDATGIDGNIVIRAYLDASRIGISDTYDGTESDNMGTTNEWASGRTIFTTTEWNSLQTNGVSFQIKVEANEGIWVDNPYLLFNIMKKNADTTTQINFLYGASSSNGQGIYRLKGTESDDYPIYYYRGEIYDNNVLFGGFCWQIIRTTDTGGIKLIYNGLPDVTGSGNNILYNCGTTRDIINLASSSEWIGDSQGYYYADSFEITNLEGNNVTYKLKSKNNPITQVPIADASEAESKTPTIVANYPYTCLSRNADATCTTLYKIVSYASNKNAYAYSSDYMYTIGKSRFSEYGGSAADMGYMKNARYPYIRGAAETGAIFGKSVEWDGTNYLLIEDTPNVASTNETLDADHHYTCYTSGTSSCTNVSYYFSSNRDYVYLGDGDTIEDALYKMTGNGSAETKQKNTGYNLNASDSTIKEAIDTWFRTNLTDEVDNTKDDYSIYLEDTVYCNDRSVSNYEQSGWNHNGGSLNESLYFGSTTRQFSWYSTTNVPAVNNRGQIPNVACPNENDRFTVSSTNGNGKLTYPVGLITADEMRLAGSSSNYGNYSYYLCINPYTWTMTPFDVAPHALGYYVSGYDLYTTSAGSNYHIRPVISLKNDTKIFEGGDGTGTNPYIVKYN